MRDLLIWGRGINEYKFMQKQQDLDVHSLKIHELALALTVYCCLVYSVTPVALYSAYTTLGLSSSLLLLRLENLYFICVTQGG